MHHQTFSIKGMHCAACTKLSAKKIMKIDGVVEANVDLGSGVAALHTDRLISVQEINAQLSDTDYRAEER